MTLFVLLLLLHFHFHVRTCHIVLSCDVMCQIPPGNKNFSFKLVSFFFIYNFCMTHYSFIYSLSPLLPFLVLVRSSTCACVYSAQRLVYFRLKEDMMMQVNLHDLSHLHCGFLFLSFEIKWVLGIDWIVRNRFVMET